LKIVAALAGMFAGALAGWLVPSLLITHSREFDGIAIMGLQMIGVPLGALVGLLVGLSTVRKPKDHDGKPSP
jgi:hypothetical protein